MSDEPHCHDESHQDAAPQKPLHVTAAEERTHPAYRLLARAMLALARLGSEREADPSAPTPDAQENRDEVGNG